MQREDVQQPPDNRANNSGDSANKLWLMLLLLELSSSKAI
jgi:hypothetical protein